MAGLSQSDKYRFCKAETESVSPFLLGCKIIMSEQLDIRSNNKVWRVIHWHVCKKFNIPVPQNSWKHEPKSITENKEVTLTYDMMILSCVNVENKAL